MRRDCRQCSGCVRRSGRSVRSKPLSKGCPGTPRNRSANRSAQQKSQPRVIFEQPVTGFAGDGIPGSVRPFNLSRCRHDFVLEKKRTNSSYAVLSASGLASIGCRMLAVQREVRLAQPSREQAIETTAIIVQFAQALAPRMFANNMTPEAAWFARTMSGRGESGRQETRRGP
jgi:hypothetical protein